MLQQAIHFGVGASLFLIVFSLGLRATPADALSLFRQPGLLLRSVLAMNVLMVALVALFDWAFVLHPAIEVALVCLAVAPVPPLLPGKQLRAGGDGHYVVGLFAAMAILSVVMVPLAIEALSLAFAREAHVDVMRIAGIVGTSILLPLAAGILVRALAPAMASRLDHPLSLAGTALLALCALPLLVSSFPQLWSLVGSGVVLVLLAFTVVGLAVGHLLGGPDPADRTVLALATATRHPAIAMAVGAAALPGDPMVGVVIVWHLVFAALFAAPYVRWRAGEG